MFSERLLRSICDYQRHAKGSSFVAIIRRKIARARHVFWTIVTQADIDPNADITFDLNLPHPNGVVIHGDAKIGTGCMFMQQVTIGMIGTGQVPVIGNNVYIGAGAKVLGSVVIGDGARIGANAVILTDVPAGCTAVGIPARIIGQQAAARPEIGHLKEQ